MMLECPSLICVCFLFFSAVQTKPVAEIRAFPLYQQCESFQSENQGVLSAISSLRDKDPQKRIRAAEQLAKSCDSRAVDPLIAVLNDEEVSVRVAVVEALGQIGHRKAIEPLIEAISDKDWRVRVALGRTLCSFQTHQTGHAVLNILVNPGDQKIAEEGEIRARCLGVLEINQLRDVGFSRKAVGFLFRLLDHENVNFRRLAEQTALELKSTRNGYHELIGILKQHGYPDFRRKAAFWLGQFNIEEAREPLAEASATDRDPGVRRVAAEALAKMKKQ
jgi:HEAT repeat protein